MENFDELKPDFYIIPICLEPVETPEPLNNFHWLDYFPEGADEKRIDALDIVAEKVTKNKS